MTHERELLAARLFLRAAFPVMKVVLEDDPAMKRRFRDVVARVQFRAQDGGGAELGACLVFDRGAFRVEQGISERADLTFAFASVEAMNKLLRGGLALPRLAGWTNVGLLVRMLTLLLSLKLMMPTARPKQPLKQRLKVKMSLYMVTTALSQYNKGGDAEMTKWTGRQPDRVYQLSVEPEGIAAYLRVKAGNSKAGRGLYTRRRPFVHMRFKGVAGALQILLRQVEFVEGVGKGCISIEGSPEYAAQLNDFMMRIQAMMT